MKAEQTKGLVRRLLFGLAEQLLQPLFQPGHGHVDEKCQDAARQNGQHQIHKTCCKGEHIRKPQQCNKKCYPHNGDEQRAFGVRIHDEVPFPECTAASWNEAAAEPLLYCTRCAGLVKTAEKGSAQSYKILRSSCTRSPTMIGLDKKPFMPLASALRRSSSKALAVMARMGIPASAGSSKARICRVAV